MSKDFLAKIIKGELLENASDYSFAKITPSGREVLTFIKQNLKAAITRYPSTGTTVFTLVFRKK